MAASSLSPNDLNIAIVLTALDLATRDIDSVNVHVKKLIEELNKNEFERAGEGVAKLTTVIQGATAPLAGAAAGALALGGAIAYLAGGMANTALNASVAYEEEIAGLGKVLAGGIEEAKAHGAALDELSIKYAADGKSLVGAMANFVQAGFDAKDAFTLVEQSLLLMNSGEMAAEEASTMIVQLLKGFKAPASEAAAAIDGINEVANKYATDNRQLGIAMAALSPIAEKMGFTMGEAAALATPIIEVFGSGAEAADALKVGLLRLTDDSKPTKELLSSIGVSQKGANQELRSGKEIYLDVAKALSGMAKTEQLYYTGQLVGIEQAGRMSEALSGTAKYAQILATYMNAAGSATSEAAVRIATSEAQIKRADEAYRQLSTSIGNHFKPQVIGVVKAAGDLELAFKRVSDGGGLDPFFAAFAPQITAIQNLLEAMAGNLEAAFSGVSFQPILDGLAVFGLDFRALLGSIFDDVDLTTVDGLRRLLQGLVNMMGDFAAQLGGMMQGLRPLGAAIGELAQFLSTAWPEFSHLKGEIIGLGASVNLTIPIIGGIFSAFLNGIGTVIKITGEFALLTAGIKLLNMAGISVLPMLGTLIARFFALNPAMAGFVAAMAGLPGTVAVLTAGAGAAGVAVGLLFNELYRLGSTSFGGTGSLGADLFDLKEAITGTADEATRAVTADELAAAAKNRLAREAQQATEAILAEAAAQRESEDAAAQALEASQLRLELNNALTDAFAEQGLVWNKTSGAFLTQTYLMAANTEKVRNALKAMGVEGTDALKMIAQEAADAFDTLSFGAATSTEKLAEVWQKSAEAAIASGNTVLQAKAAQNAASLGLSHVYEQMLERTAQVEAKTHGDQSKSITSLLAQRDKLSTSIKSLGKDSEEAAPLLHQLAIVNIQIKDAATDAAKAIDAETAAINHALEVTKARLELHKLEIQRLIQLAKVRGDEAEVARLSAILVSDDAKAAKAAAKAKDEEATAIARKVKMIELAAKADGDYTQEEQAQVQALKDKAELLQIEADQLDVTAKMKKTDAAEAQKGATAIGDYTSAVDRNTQAVDTNVASVQRHATAVSDLADEYNKAVEAAAALAESSGQTQTLENPDGSTTTVDSMGITRSTRSVGVPMGGADGVSAGAGGSLTMQVASDPQSMNRTLAEVIRQRDILQARLNSQPLRWPVELSPEQASTVLASKTVGGYA